MLDFRIETFLCVCRNMSYTKAAKELNMTQPGVSQHIKFLEKYYGDKLFNFSNRVLSLTQAGKDLHDAMISIKCDDIHLKKKIIERAADKKIIKFGSTLTVGEFWMPSKLISYIKTNSNVQIEFVIANTKELLSLLDNGEIDFAIVEGYFNKSEYESIKVSNQNYVLACGYNYPLDEIKSLKDLFKHNLIVRENGSGSKEILERYLFENGYSIKDFHSISTINSINVIKIFLENECGISFMYEIAIAKEIKEKKIKVINMPDFNIYHEFNYIWRKNSVFHEYYKEIYESLLEFNSYEN